PYHLLHLRYIEVHTVQEVARELGLSERQAYRDLRRAEESVAALLWARHAQAGADTAPPDTAPQRARSISAVEVEVSRLEMTPSPVDIGQLLQRALRAVEQLAQQYGLQLSLVLPPNPLIV